MGSEERRRRSGEGKEVTSLGVRSWAKKNLESQL